MLRFKEKIKNKKKLWHDHHLLKRKFKVGQKVFLHNYRLRLFYKLKTKWFRPFTVMEVYSLGTVEGEVQSQWLMIETINWGRPYTHSRIAWVKLKRVELKIIKQRPLARQPKLIEFLYFSLISVYLFPFNLV